MGGNRRPTSQRLLGSSRSQEQNEATGPVPEDTLGQHQASGTLNLGVMLNRRGEAEAPCRLVWQKPRAGRSEAEHSPDDAGCIQTADSVISALGG